MSSRYVHLKERVRSKLSYWVGLARMEFTGDLHRLMEQQGINRAELARRLETSQAYVTKALAGNTNFTLKTMAKLARSMDAVLHVRLTTDEDVVRIVDPRTASLLDAGVRPSGASDQATDARVFVVPVPVPYRIAGELDLPAGASDSRIVSAELVN